MKIAGLIIGIVLMILSGIGVVVCLLLPSMNSHVSFEESMMVFIPTAVLFVVALLGTVVSAIFFFKKRKTAAL